MNELTNWMDILMSSFQSFGEQFMGAIPAILGALLILFIGWLFAKLISRSISKLLKVAKFNDLAEKFNISDMLRKANVNMTSSEFVGRFVYWIILLLVIISAADVLGWNSVSNEISKLIGYLPNLFIAIIFFVVGTYIAAFVRDIIKGAASSLSISTGKIISTVVYYLLFIIVALTALEQAGIDTSIITSNLLIIMGAVLAAAAISYGFASRDLLANILAGYYSRHNFTEGDVIEVDGLKGEIISSNSISVTLQLDGNEKVVIPSHRLVTEKVKLYEK